VNSLATNEAKLLLILSRVCPDTAALQKAASLISPSFNWDSFTALSIKHCTSALIYRHLVDLNGVPRHIVEKFKAMYNNLIKTNILMISELDRIIGMLNKADVEVIALKGATASETIFGDIGVYPSSDIDILVRVEDIDRVRTILEVDGYVLNDAGFDEYREYFIREQYHINLTKGTYTIEPHWNLFIRYFNTPPAFWWEESISISSGEKGYRFLSPEKNILYTSFRNFSKGFEHFRFLVLIAEIIRHYRDAINWDKLFSYAREYKFENVLRITMKLVSELLGAPVPDRYKIVKGIMPKLFYGHIVKMELREEIAHPLYKMLWTFLSDDLTGALKVILRRLFPSMGEIVSRYRLPVGSNKAIIYYILNPLFLVLRKHQKG
jgi:hypothetical protein